MAVYELESVDALHTEEYMRMSNNPTEWTKRMSPNIVGRGTVRNVYTQIYPAESDPHTLGRGMAPALQIGRMDVPQEVEAKYNEYYDTVRTPANLDIPRVYVRPSLPCRRGRPQVPDGVRVRTRKGTGNVGMGEAAGLGHDAPVYRRRLRTRPGVAGRLSPRLPAPCILIGRKGPRPIYHPFGEGIYLNSS